MEKTTKERIAIVETEVTDIKADVKEIKTNHLPHLQDKLDKFMFWIIGLVVSAILTLSGTIINVVLNLRR